MPELGPEQLAWSQDVMRRQVSQLTLLINDLLDVSRVTQGKIQLRKERLELVSVIERAIATVRPLIETFRHKLVISSDGPKWLDADPARLEQVLVNLLTNAAKYTNEGGQISLTTEQLGDELRIRVKDTGIGMSTETLTQVFELFGQATRSLARSQGGLGIGLTLVRTLVELHGGRVEATSGGEGHGSEFIVTLPAAEKPALAPQSGEHTIARTGSKRVLIVDDNRDAAMALSMLLHVFGHQTAVVGDPLAALEVARELKPQVALLDIGLPGMTGYELVEKLQQCNGLNGTCYIAVSGYGQSEDRRRSKEAGFHHHLIKPVMGDELLGLFATLDR